VAVALKVPRGTFLQACAAAGSKPCSRSGPRCSRRRSLAAGAAQKALCHRRSPFAERWVWRANQPSHQEGEGATPFPPQSLRNNAPKRFLRW
jgi:hypothetical protein